MPNISKIHDDRFTNRWILSGAIKTSLSRKITRSFVLGRMKTLVNEYRENNISWLDAIGTVLENENIKPGCIFEFHQYRFQEQSCKGGIVVFSNIVDFPEIDNAVAIFIMSSDDGTISVIDCKDPRFIESFQFLDLC